MPQKRKKAVVVGVGPIEGLGGGVARKFAANGCHVLVAGRTREKLDLVVENIRQAGGSAIAVPTDASDPAAVEALFDLAMADDDSGSPANLVVHNVGNNQPLPLLDITPELFESFWRMNTLSGFLVAQAVARRFVVAGGGTLIFTGASGSLRGMARYAHFASSKAGLRMIAQSMAREYGPQGVHVAHALIDGGIDGERLRLRFPEFRARLGADGMLDIDAIAEAYWQLHLQPRSAWTQELDLRPFKENF
ncbi:MAG: SDR family NAD(P)-dependent oxidoreductase [Methylocystis sp.]|jgi:NAD(P)-dependent dehydrogenase (short-subunit alcohol dehydrogenase family)|uniref:SDR family NAD(P)-dependent oxidoreductase n=1 Tax=Phenylobacterium sp. TaxID=1871053 RepID=UPI0025F524DA|nr:SDR family NAD(P)-dependent oxidoreductase [Phenylobacterium sp.]MCA3292288.1 SDR family NAD(P)-dependent oxidoreductase [Roseomonas sp.]MCA3589731.1 SDR family NAD(P)-dependent oxidoreductase [Methylocystis sp.]MCA3341859.1 SDR family NAD(P)-dependent oxidoreductase [Roseomonas sp.]MCA6310341.1 SDR family NAD(P)-dependent oxidoreductase [Phenylobacterium sp.]MCA6337264.1 SDR family NAD(P)-dependent oxidoreductase [Phenylobacterium sp.]